MHDYDTVLKSLLAGSENSLFARITGVSRGRWLNVELPRVNQPRVDLLFKPIGGRPRLISLELLSFNDLLLPVRMAEYSLSVYRAYKIFPEQFALYVGGSPMRMPSALVSPNLHCRFTLIDIRDLDAELLLRSPLPADVVLAILARHSNSLETIRQILTRIAKLERAAGVAAFSKLMILAGLRKLEGAIRKEAIQMPITADIMDHKIIGPAIRKGLAQGMEKGLQKGLEEGMKQGLHEGREEGRHLEALNLLSRLITERFGPVSPAHKKRLAKMSVADLEQLSIRLLRVNSVDKLFASS